jgi:phosphoglycolate phosphatase
LSRGLEAILFDLDGTLITCALDFPAMKQSVIDLAVAHGVPSDDLEGLDILGAAEQAARALGEAQAPGFRARVEEELSRQEVAAAESAQPMPGALESLAALNRQGITLGIVTRNCRRAVLLSLTRVPLPHQVLLTRDDVPRPKPDPDHLLRALKLLGARPQRSLMVGDHRMDVEAGQGAGMRTAGLGAEEAWRARFPACCPDHHLSSLGDLLRLVGEP